jgi:hypothetical protein
MKGILAALDVKAAEIRGIERTAIGTSPINGLSLDMAPWQGGVGLSMRLVDEMYGEGRRDIAAWKYFDFVSNDNCPGLQPAAEFIKAAYESEGEAYYREMAHLIFLAAADALLDATVTARLTDLGLNAPVVGSDFGHHHLFEYMVFDPDATIEANYCEIVLANRVTARFIKRDRGD